MLDPDQVDLDALAEALADRTPGRVWWCERASGRVRCHGDERDEGPEWVRIEPTSSQESYQDMSDFVAGVQHRRAAELLDRATNGRGAFRRFKNTLFEFPELRDQWYRLRDARSRRRALVWLSETGLVDPAAAERAAASHPDPTPHHEEVPVAVALELRELFGERLRQVLVYGSFARGDDAPEPGIELLVVLDEVTSVWAELRAMDEVLWRHTERSGFAVTALPLGHAEFARPTSPVVLRARVEAVRIT